MRPRPTSTGARRRRPLLRAVVAAWLPLVASPGALAQAAAGEGAGFRVVPTFSVSETLTSNRDLSSSDPKRDAITRVSPGVSISGGTGALRGSLGYSLNAIHNASDPGTVRLQNALDAVGSALSPDGRASADITASISQQTISAFGTRSNDSSLDSGNRSEVFGLSARAAYNTVLAGFATLGASVNGATSASKGTRFGDSSNYGGQVNVGARHGIFGWNAYGSRQIGDFKAGRATTTDAVGVSLSAAPRYDLSLSVTFGRQRSDVLDGASPWIDTTGWSVAWQPTERTSISVQRSRTYYGHSHSYALTHRMARSVWSYVDSTSASGSNTPVPVPLTLYDLLYSICLRNSGTPVTCDLQTQNQIRSNNLAPGTVVGFGLLNPGVTLQRTKLLAFSISGTRDTITFSAMRNSVQALDRSIPLAPDLATGEPVRLEQFTVGVSHSLTADSSLSLSASQSRVLDTTTQRGNRLRTATLGWGVSPGPRSTVSLNARATDFDSPTLPYREYALVGSLSLRF